MADYGRVGPVAALAAAATTPLVLTLAPRELVALAVGSGLVGALVRMTFIDGDIPPDAARCDEAEAIWAQAHDWR